MEEGMRRLGRPRGRKVIDMAGERRARAHAKAAPAKERKTETLAIKMTPSEKERIQALADAQEKTMSDYVREIIRDIARGHTLVAPSSS